MIIIKLNNYKQLKMEYTQYIIDTFKDLLNTDLSNFDEKKDIYGGFSLSHLIRLILNNKQILLTYCEDKRQGEEDKRLFVFDHHYKDSKIKLNTKQSILIITNNDRKIFKKFSLFRLYCVKCHSTKQKEDGTNVLHICSECKAVRYCCSECQKYDWKHHKLICKPLKKALSNNDELPPVKEIIRQLKDKEGNPIQRRINTKNDKRIDIYMRALKACRKKKGSSYK